MPALVKVPMGNGDVVGVNRLGIEVVAPHGKKKTTVFFKMWFPFLEDSLLVWGGPPEIRRFWRSHHDPGFHQLLNMSLSSIGFLTTLGREVCWCKPNEDFDIWVGLQLFIPKNFNQKGWDSRIPFFVWRSFFLGQFRESNFSICTICTIFFVNPMSVLGILCMSLFVVWNTQQIVWCFIFKDDTCTFDSWISIPPIKKANQR